MGICFCLIRETFCPVLNETKENGMGSSQIICYKVFFFVSVIRWPSRPPVKPSKHYFYFCIFFMSKMISLDLIFQHFSHACEFEFEDINNFIVNFDSPLYTVQSTQMRIQKKCWTYNSPSHQFWLQCSCQSLGSIALLVRFDQCWEISYYVNAKITRTFTTTSTPFQGFPPSVGLLLWPQVL